MKFEILVATEDSYARNVFEDITTMLHQSLVELKHEASVSYGAPKGSGFLIVLCSHYLRPVLMPRNAILYNFEQVRHFTWHNARAVISTHDPGLLWDYSPANAARYEAHLSKPVAVVALGDHPTLHKGIERQDAGNFLFFGHQFPRRTFLLDQLRKAGVSVHVMGQKFGHWRSVEISRASALVNLHNMADGIFEQARAAIALANGLPVLSEESAGNEGAAGSSVDWSVPSFSSSRLVEEIRKLAGDRQELRRLGERSFSAFSGTSMRRNVEAALDKTLRGHDLAKVRVYVLPPPKAPPSAKISAHTKPTPLAAHAQRVRLARNASRTVNVVNRVKR
jgi:hypothetical protein